jgi:hypothetical protein
MKTILRPLMAAMALSAAMAAGSSSAAEMGWFDSVDEGWVDDAKGWVCMNEDPANTPSYGSLDVYLDAPAEQGGFYYGNFTLDNGSTYGFFKDGVNAAGYCGTDSYVGFDISGWFSNDDSSDTPVYIYWRDLTGNLTMLGGSPITISAIGTNKDGTGSKY